MKTTPPVASRALAAGVLCAAAESGVLVGIGHRAGTTWRPLNALAHAVMGGRADDVWTFSWSVTPAGIMVLFAVSIVAALMASALAGRASWLRALASAAAIAVAAYLLHLHVIARTPGGLAEVLEVGELRAVYTVAWIALAAGMRLAFPVHDATLDP